MKRVISSLSFIFIFILISFVTGFASNQRWMIKPVIETTRSTVTFRNLLMTQRALDAFSPEVLNQTLFHVKNPGKTRFTREEVRNKLRSLFPVGSSPSLRVPPGGILINRIYRIKKERIAQAFRETFHSHFRRLGKIYLNELKISGDTKIPDPSYRIVPCPPVRFQKAMRIKMKIKGNGWERTLFVRGKISIIANVLVAKKSIEKGEKIGPENTALIEQDTTQIHRPYLSNLRDCEGLVAKRTIPEGRIISPESLTPPILVRRGEVVTIQVQTPNILITTLGLAKQEGRRGDMIRVENIQSRKMIYAKVISKHLVTVEF